MIRISPDSPLKSKIQDANKKMIRKMTALLWFKYSHLIYINTSVSACTIFKLNCSEL